MALDASQSGIKGSVMESLGGYQVSSADQSVVDTCAISSNQTKLHWKAPTRENEIGSRSPRTERHVSLPLDDSVPPEVPTKAKSHSRRDVLTGDWVIFAPERNQRPNDFSSLEVATNRSNIDDPTQVIDADCPFCLGSEESTPEAVWSAKLSDDLAAIHAASGQGIRGAASEPTRLARTAVNIKQGEQSDWDIRVVPNKFPAVSPVGEDLEENETSSVGEHSAFFPIADVVGGHEVIIESSCHSEAITQMDPSVAYLSLLAFRDRIRYWRGVPGIQFISVFKNCGREAGASLRHSHSQLIATSIMPHRVRTTLQRAETHRARTGCSLGCDLLRSEISERQRLIDRTDSLVAYCPFASRFPGMIRITSVKHQPHFDELSDSALDRLASFLWRAVTWVDEAYPGKAYNYILNTCPPGAKSSAAFQWTIDLFPRLAKTAGFEWSSDCMINPLLPELAAQNYRRTAVKDDPRELLKSV